MSGTGNTDDTIVTVGADPVEMEEDILTHLKEWHEWTLVHEYAPSGLRAIHDWYLHAGLTADDLTHHVHPVSKGG